MVATKAVVHIGDLTAEQAYIKDRVSPAVAAVELGGVRTILAVPMLNKSEMIGAFTVYRQEVRPFTDKQIALINNFAAQAVIAIENTRLLNELRQRTTDLTERTTDLTEALEQQTATSEVLQVIRSSPGDPQPIFATMLESAVRICDAKFGNIYRWDGEPCTLIASHNTPPAFAEAREWVHRFAQVERPVRRMLTTKTVYSRRRPCGRGGTYVERHDPAALPPSNLEGYGRSVCTNAEGGRTDRCVQLVSDRKSRPFTDKQIELVKNFAAQAVIAIENARLLNELRQRTTDLTERTADLTEALEQQTATSEVLQVISSSPGDLEPVFATMLENAVRICDATFGNIYHWDGEALHLLATHNTPPAFAEARRRSPRYPNANIPAGRVAATKTVVHVADLAAEQAYIGQRDPATVAAVELGGVRTFLAVPMLKENRLIGTFALARQEVRPFTDKQVELVKNFAAQAVIAIENARLLNELRQSLERQTATSEVLAGHLKLSRRP